MQTKRLFLAIPINDEVRMLCKEFIEANQHLNCRWIKAENWHITTIFIGDFPASLTEELIQNLDIHFSKQKAFNLNWDQFTYAPDQRNPRMIWGKFQHSSAFDEMILASFQNLKAFYQKHQLDFQIKIRGKNTPHITLTRLKKARHFPELSSPFNTPDKLQVHNCLLYESVLLPKGAQYHILHDFSFSGH